MCRAPTYPNHQGHLMQDRTALGLLNRNPAAGVCNIRNCRGVDVAGYCSTGMGCIRAAYIREKDASSGPGKREYVLRGDLVPDQAPFSPQLRHCGAHAIASPLASAGERWSTRKNRKKLQCLLWDDFTIQICLRMISLAVHRCGDEVSSQHKHPTVSELHSWVRVRGVFALTPRSETASLVRMARTTSSALSSPQYDVHERGLLAVRDPLQ